jgi:mannose-6-phosphate isomerase-like protein (cupin superfamily)
MREERLVFGGIPIVIRVNAEDSGGAMTVLEEVEPMSDTPLHVHSREDELFYVVEGRAHLPARERGVPARSRRGDFLPAPHPPRPASG